MGRIYAKIELIRTYDLAYVNDGSLSKDKVRRMDIDILVDTGADMLAINEHIKNQLDLPVILIKECRLADGSVLPLEIVGPVDIQFGNRGTTTRAIVLPGNAEPLLGAIPLEDLDVVLLPKEQRMIPNPDSPYMATTYLK